MCGIAGIFGGTGAAGHLAAPLVEALRHRGPDDHGWLTLDPDRTTHGGILPAPPTPCRALLVHTRLSIIDLTPAARQPFASADGRHHLVFNGEIYNYRELRAQLEAVGESFRTTSDSEVLLAAYRHWGAPCLSRLVGMFAFAILDRRAGTLFLARDPFGIKPLYTAPWKGGLAFASEIPPLLQLPGMVRQANPQAVYDYLLFGITDHRPGESLLRTISPLPPGTFLHLTLEEPLSPTPTPWWHPPRPAGEDRPLAADAAPALRERLLESVALHLRADVPVAAALSGGLDSSSLVMAMNHLEPGEERHLFCYLADDPALNEERWIRVVAEATNGIIHPVRPDPAALGESMDGFLQAQGEPVSSTSMFAQYQVYRAAREAGFKVVVDGQGADELLAGYDYFLGARLTGLLRRREWGAALGLARHAWRRPGVGPKLAFYLGEYLIPPAWHALPRRLAGHPLEPPWLGREWFAAHRVRAITPRHSRSPFALGEALEESLTRTGLPKLLRYQDRNSMANGVESRVPFLTTALAEFLATLPEEALLDDRGLSKAVLRRAMGGLVPPAILERRDKVGFVTTEAQWLRAMGGRVEELLAGTGTVPALDGGKLGELWQRARNGRGGERAVWRAVGLLWWARRFGVGFP